MISFKQHAEIEESSKKGLQNKASKSGFAYKTLKKEIASLIYTKMRNIY